MCITDLVCRWRALCELCEAFRVAEGSLRTGDALTLQATELLKTSFQSPARAP